MIPTSIDGTDITGATIDGTDVTEITVDGQTVFSAGIPDVVVPGKEIHSYPVDTFTASNWPDGIGTSDIDTISGPTLNSSLFGGEGGVECDASSNDFLQSDSMGNFASNNLDGTFAMAVGFSTTGGGFMLGFLNSDTLLDMSAGRTTTDKLEFGRRGQDKNSQVFHGPSVTDGDEYVVIINSQGSAASDIEVYFEANNDVASIFTNQGNTGNPLNVGTMTYGARDKRGTIDGHIDVEFNTIRWFDDSLTQSEREDVFDSYTWYDPSTDAP